MMKTMKRTVSILLAAVLCMAMLTGCGGSSGINWRTVVMDLGADSNVRANYELNAVVNDALSLAVVMAEGNMTEQEYTEILEAKYPQFTNEYGSFVIGAGLSEEQAVNSLYSYKGRMTAVTQYGAGSIAVSAGERTLWLVMIIGIYS